MLWCQRCGPIAAPIEEADREAPLEQAEPTGVLRVSAPVRYGRRFLAPMIGSYTALRGIDRRRERLQRLRAGRASVVSPLPGGRRLRPAAPEVHCVEA